MIFLRSLLFLLWFIAVTLVLGVIGLPLLLGPRSIAESNLAAGAKCHRR